MKNFLFFFFFLTTISYSQEVSFGLKGGLNFTNFSGQNVEGLNFRNATNFHLGAVSEVEFNVNFKLQVDLLYNIVGTEVKTLTEQYENKMGYVTIPVALKLAVSSRKTFLEGGAQVSYLLTEQRNSLSEIQEQWQTKNDYDFGVFVGLSYHPMDKLFLQARYYFGLTDIKVIDEKSFKNQGFSLSLGYLLF
jgi:opacity protein-like surface antigen